MTGGIDDKVLSWAVKGHVLTRGDLIQLQQSSLRHFPYVHENRDFLGDKDAAVFVSAFWEYITHIKVCGGCKLRKDQQKLVEETANKMASNL